MPDFVNWIKTKFTFEGDKSALAQIAKDADRADTEVQGLQRTMALPPPIAGFENVRAKLAAVDQQAGLTKQTMGTFASATVHSIPGISDKLGPLGGALGQVANQAAQGATNLAAMGGTAVGVAAVGAAMKGLSDASERQDKIDLWNKEQVEAWTKAVIEGGNQVDKLNQRLTAVSKIEVDAGLGHKFDITPLLAEAGITVDQFSEAVVNGGAGLDLFKRALDASALSADEQHWVLKAVTDQQAKYADAQTKAAAVQAVFKDAVTGSDSALSAHHDTVVDGVKANQDLAESLSETDRETRRATESTHTLGANMEVAGRLAKEEADGLSAARKELQGMTSDALAAIDAQAAFDISALELKKSIADYNAEIASGKLKGDEATLATLKLGESSKETARKFAESKGAAKDSAEAINLQILQLTKERDLLAPGSALYQNLQGIIDKFKQLASAARMMPDTGAVSTHHDSSGSGQGFGKGEGGTTGGAKGGTSGKTQIWNGSAWVDAPAEAVTGTSDADKAKNAYEQGRMSYEEYHKIVMEGQKEAIATYGIDSNEAAAYYRLLHDLETQHQADLDATAAAKKKADDDAVAAAEGEGERTRHLQEVNEKYLADTIALNEAKKKGDQEEIARLTAIVAADQLAQAQAMAAVAAGGSSGAAYDSSLAGLLQQLIALTGDQTGKLAQYLGTVPVFKLIFDDGTIRQITARQQAMAGGAT